MFNTFNIKHYSNNPITLCWELCSLWVIFTRFTWSCAFFTGCSFWCYRAAIVLKQHVACSPLLFNPQEKGEGDPQIDSYNVTSIMHKLKAWVENAPGVLFNLLGLKSGFITTSNLPTVWCKHTDPPPQTSCLIILLSEKYFLYKHRKVQNNFLSLNSQYKDLQIVIIKSQSLIYQLSLIW